MKAEISRKFDYTYAIVRNEGGMSTFMDRDIESIEAAIMSLERNKILDNATNQIIVMYAEVNQ